MGSPMCTNLYLTAPISTSSKLSAHGVWPLPYWNGEPAAHRDSLKALLGVQGRKRDLLSPLLPQGHLLSSPCRTMHMRLTWTVNHAEATNTRQLDHIARTHAARPPPARVHRGKFGMLLEMSYGSEPIYFVRQFDGLLPGLLQKMHKPRSPPGGGRVLSPRSPARKVKCEARGWRSGVHLLQREPLGLLQIHP